MYNKLFTKILDSSIWLETNPTRIVWITMIAAMDEQGFVSMASIHNLARRANVSLAEAEDAIRVLESPDTIQPNQEHEGRRLERVEGGWMVLNSEKYRSMVTRAESLHRNRERVAKFRAKKKACNAPVMGCNDLVMQSEQIRANQKSLAAPKAPRARNEICDALARACGIDPFQMTARQAQSCAVAAAEIKRVSPEVGAAQFEARAGVYRLKYRDAALTPRALCDHWGELFGVVGVNGKPRRSQEDLDAEQARLESMMAKQKGI